MDSTRRAACHRKISNPETAENLQHYTLSEKKTSTFQHCVNSKIVFKRDQKTSCSLFVEPLPLLEGLPTSSLRPKAISMARACAAALKLGTASAFRSWRVVTYCLPFRHLFTFPFPGKVWEY